MLKLSVNDVIIAIDRPAIAAVALREALALYVDDLNDHRDRQSVEPYHAAARQLHAQIARAIENGGDK